MGCCCDHPEQAEFVTAELNIPLHCKGCERAVVNTLFKFEGVESVKSSFDEQKVVVTGRIDLPKLVKRIKWKTGKMAEIVEVTSSSDCTVEEGPANFHHGCSCSLCRPSYDYCMPRCMSRRVAPHYDMHYVMPYEENNSSFCSIM